MWKKISGLLCLAMMALQSQPRSQLAVTPASAPAVVRATTAVDPGSGPLIAVGASRSDYRIIAHTFDKDIAEIVALVPAGTSTITLMPGTPTAGFPNTTRYILNSLSLSINGQSFPLTGISQYKRLYRRGSALLTAEFHAAVGPFGHVETWVSARADALQLDVQLLWHRAIPGPDVLFSSARLLTPSGTTFTPSLPDPACAPPFLVTPGTYNIPQQFGRAFYLSVHPIGQAPRPEYVGTGDWSSGGYLPSSFPVPALQGTPSLLQPLQDARDRLRLLLPEGDGDAAPVSALWPAGGVLAAGGGGGIGRYPLDGIRWAGSQGDPYALELARIQLLRGLSRARIRLGPEGDPLDLDAAGGSWRFWDGFSNGQDSPWEWDSYSEHWVGADPRYFADHDLPSMFRRLRSCWKLAWLANDPIARLLSLEGATRARLTFWEGPGRAHRFDPFPTTSGRGSDYGTWQGTAALAIAVARSLGATEYESWISYFRSYLAAAQMPSGEVTNRAGGYPSELSPFFGVYKLAGAADTAYLSLALYSLGDRSTCRNMMRAVANLGTPDTGQAGLFYYWPVSTVDPNGPDFETRDDWPLWTAAFMGVTGHEGYLTAWDQGYATAIAVATGAPEASVLVSRFAAAPQMRSWGLVAPDSHTRAPIEQWWPLLGILE